MDERDCLILQSLSEDNRTSLTEIGQKTGLSRSAVKDRVERLFGNRIILGSTIVVDPALVGINRTVFFELKTNPHEPWLAKMLEETSSCDLLDGIAGEFSLLARFRLVDDEHFGRILRKVDEAMGRTYFKKYRVVNAIRAFKESGVSLRANGKRTAAVDATDLKLLDILMNQEAYSKSPLPLSTVDLSKQLGRFGISISQPAVFHRLSRLEKVNVILRHTLKVDYIKLGLQTKFIARIKANPNVYDSVAQEFLAPMPEIFDLYRTGEEYGLLATVRVKDVSDYNSFLLRLYESKGIMDTYTNAVLEERKNSPMSLTTE
jgi:Lrp/AsnC family leucine-responsive transcriptional regulator